MAGVAEGLHHANVHITLEVEDADVFEFLGRWPYIQQKLERHGRIAFAEVYMTSNYIRLVDHNHE